MAGVPRPLLTWMLNLNLSVTVKSARRDFANGYLVAEIINKHVPRELSLHMFDTSASLPRKQANWALLTKFLKKKGIHVEQDVVKDIINAQEGAVVPLLEALMDWLKHVNAGGPAAYRSLETVPTVVRHGAPAQPPPAKLEGGAAAAAYPAAPPTPTLDAPTYAPYESGLEGAARSPGRPRAPPVPYETPVLEHNMYAKPPAAFVFGGTEYDRPPRPTPALTRLGEPPSRGALEGAGSGTRHIGAALAPRAQAYVPWGGAYSYAAEATVASAPPPPLTPYTPASPSVAKAPASPRSPSTYGVTARTDSYAPIAPALPVPLREPSMPAAPSLLTPEEREAARVRQARMATRRADERRGMAGGAALKSPAPERARRAAPAPAPAIPAVSEDDLRHQREVASQIARRDAARAERSGGYWELGALGSDKDPTELEAKRAKAAEARALAQRWGAENRRKLAMQAAPPPAPSPASPTKSARERALQFAKHVPKPAVSAEARTAAAAPPPFGGGPGRVRGGGPAKSGARPSAAAAAAPAAAPSVRRAVAPSGGGLSELELLELRHEEDRLLAERLRRDLGLPA